MWFVVESESDHIREINNLAGLYSTKDNVLSYLNFYYRMMGIGSTKGCMNMTENWDAEMPDTGSAVLERVTDGGAFLCRCAVLHPEGLYSTQFRIEAGTVSVVANTPLGDDE